MAFFLTLQRSTRLAVFLVLGTALAGTATAGNPAPLSAPNLQLMTNGEVTAIARAPDGSIVIGGSFSMVGGMPHRNLARLKPDGTLDEAWAPTADSYVFALAADADGTIFIGGDFANVNGQPRGRLAKLVGSAGALDPSWNPGADNTVLTLSLTGGVLYAGGTFNAIGGLPRHCVAKLDLSGVGAVDDSWNPGIDGYVNALAADGSGAVFVAGSFANIGGLARANIAKLAGSGTGAADQLWNPAAVGTVAALASDSAGNIYAGGAFTNIGGQERNHVARLSAAGSGAADQLWNPAPDGDVNALASDGAGNVYVSGTFANIGGQQRAGLAKLSAADTGAADPAWNVAVSSYVTVLAAGGSKVYLGGYFNTAGGQPRSSLAAISSDGTTLPPMDVESPGQVRALAAQGDSSVIVGGDFLRAGTQQRNYLLRLQADGTLDPNWTPSANSYVSALAVDGNGDVFAGGSFNRIDGQVHRRLAKLAGTGSGAVDPNWNAGTVTDGTVFALAVAGNALYAGGTFNTIGDQAQGRIARLATGGTGSVDVNWRPSLDRVVRSMAVDGSGFVYAGGGAFFVSGSTPRWPIVKITGSGTIDSSWIPYLGMPSPSTPFVYALALNNVGDMYAGGKFRSSFVGQTQYSIAKLALDGGPYFSWAPDADDSVMAITIKNAAIYAAGQFTHIGGQARNHISKLSPDGNGAADPDWNPELDGNVWALTATANGRLYVGGAFGAAGGQTRGGIAAFDIERIFANGFE